MYFLVFSKSVEEYRNYIFNLLYIIHILVSLEMRSYQKAYPLQNTLENFIL